MRTGMDIRDIQARKTFFADFRARVGDTVEQAEMAELRAGPSAYRALGLALPGGGATLWGLLVLCKRGAYFFVPPSESAFTAMVRQAAHADAPREQLLTLSSVPGLTFALPRRTALPFLSFERPRTICASFAAPQGGTEYFSFVLNKKAAPILERMRAALDPAGHPAGS